MYAVLTLMLFSPSTEVAQPSMD